LQKSRGIPSKAAGLKILTTKLMLPSKILPVLLVPVAMTLVATHAHQQSQILDIKIVNIQKNSGSIVVEIYKDKSDWLKTPFRTLTLPASEDTGVASFNVPNGKYAVSVYPDTNKNGKLDQNFIGIPKEPAGFGNNYKPFGKPDFESALIEHTPVTKPEAIKLVSIF